MHTHKHTSNTKASLCKSHPPWHHNHRRRIRTWHRRGRGLCGTPWHTPCTLQHHPPSCTCDSGTCQHQGSTSLVSQATSQWYMSASGLDITCQSRCITVEQLKIRASHHPSVKLYHNGTCQYQGFTSPISPAVSQL